MKIILVHQYYLEKNDSGGSRWNEMTRLWAEAGHEITVIAGMIHGHKTEKYDKYKGKYLFEELYEKNIRVIRSHVSESYNKSFLGRLWAYFSFVFSSIIASVFKLSNNYDVIIVTSPPLFVGITGYFISLFKNIPLVFEIRDLWPESAIDTGILKNSLLIKFSYKYESFLYKKAKLINVLTPAFERVLVNKKNVPPNKICQIPNAADFSLSEELLQNFDSKKFKNELGLIDKFVITYVGAHGVANHLVQILETAKRLKDTPVVFLLIGDGMKKKELMEFAEKEKINNVRFIDSVPKKEVFKYILASDMGTSVLAKNDTFKTVYSNKTFDYMSCKKPILMVIDGISRELVEKADAGCYVEPENIDDYVAKINLYLNNPTLLKVQGENGYRFAKANYDREVLAERYIKIIEKCI